MNPAFDKVASSYDQEFTDTPIGRAQRDRVWRYMRKVLGRYEQARILELNCGTGEDAVFMAEMGHEVLATDISTEMLKRVEKKALGAGLEDKVRVRQLDLAAPVLEEEAGFDLIFSNFGGLNCISGEKLEELAVFCEKKLKVGGACVFVVMPPKTLLEKVYRWRKGEMEEYKQRNSQVPLMVSVGEEEVATYFHSPSMLISSFYSFLHHNTQAVGFIPSYMNASKKLVFLNMLEKVLLWTQTSPKRSDHYITYLGKHQ